MNRLRVFLRILAILPALAAALPAQVKFTGAERGVLAFGPLATRVEGRDALGMEIGYAADYRVGLAGFVTGSGGASSATVVGVSVETGVLRPQQSVPIGVVAALSMSQAFSGGNSSSGGGLAAQVYTVIGDTSVLAWYPSLVGSLVVETELFPSIGLSSELLLHVSKDVGAILAAEVSRSKLGTGYGLNLSLLFFL